MATGLHALIDGMILNRIAGPQAFDLGRAGLGWAGPGWAGRKAIAVHFAGLGAG